MKTVMLLVAFAAWAEGATKVIENVKVIDGVKVIDFTFPQRTYDAGFEIKNLKWFNGTALDTGQKVLIATGLLVAKNKFGEAEVTIKIDIAPESANWPPAPWATLKTTVVLPAGAQSVRFAAVDKDVNRADMMGHWVHMISISCNYHREGDLKRVPSQNPGASNRDPVRPSGRP